MAGPAAEEPAPQRGTGGPLAPEDTSAETDRSALEAFYHATNGPNWGHSVNWVTDSPIGAWSGVATDESGRVQSLDLPKNGLSGKLPPELGNLTNLRRLGLANNQFSGEIPRELGNLPNLIVLDLGGNQLSGEIPRELGNLPNLISLSLVENQLSGEIPRS